MIETLLAHSSDANIVLAMFTCFALAGMAVSAVSFRLFGRRLAVDYTDLVDSVEKSIFAFIVFLLALTLADVRSNFGKAGDSVIAEAFAIRQFSADLELEPGPRATLEQAVLIAYAQAVIDDEWLTLGAPVPALSPVAGARLDELRALIRADAAAIGRTLQIDRVWLAVGQLENNRQLRLQQATASAPAAFWVVSLLLIAIGAVMTGRAPLDWRRAVVLSGYFGALGVIVALILILDRPFRGDTRVSAEPIRAVITRLR